MKKLNLSNSDLKSITVKASRVLDYYNDFKSLALCKNLKDIESAKLDSSTDMGEGRSEAELKESLAGFGLKYKFDTVLLILLNYVFFNMNYELTEGLNNEIPGVKFPENFFGGYEIRCKTISDVIPLMLQDYSNDAAKKILWKAEREDAYQDVMGKKDPGALIVQHTKVALGDSFEYVFNELTTAVGIKERLEN
jgi:hypothetical protein